MNSTLQPIWEVPEVRKKVEEVSKYIRYMVKAKNLFAWKFFVEDLIVDIELEIYKYEDLHRKGLYKENGIGAYCNMAVQGALNYAFFYSAQKRRLNFECASLDAMQENQDGDGKASGYFQPKSTDSGITAVDILVSIETECGSEISSLVKKVLDGEQVSRAELTTLRKMPKIKKILTDVE